MTTYTIKSADEIAALRRSGQLVAKTFDALRPYIESGVSLLELDKVAEDFILSHNGTPAYKGYRQDASFEPFPASICTSVNEQVCHGIPSCRTLQRGDVVGIDIGVYLNGWASDACITYPVGSITHQATRLLTGAQECLRAGMAEVKPGKRLGDIGSAIQEVAESHNYSIVREMAGHGLGKNLHEGPVVEHWGRCGTGVVIRQGMVFTIEPIINVGSKEVAMLPNGWTIVTDDGNLSAQYEYTVAVTATGCDILTPWELDLMT